MEREKKKVVECAKLVSKSSHMKFLYSHNDTIEVSTKVEPKRSKKKNWVTRIQFSILLNFSILKEKN